METIKLKVDSCFLSDIMYSMMEYMHQNPKPYWMQDFETSYGGHYIINCYGEELPDTIQDYLYDTKEEFEMYAPYMGVLRLFCGHYLKVDNRYYFLSNGSPGINKDKSRDVIHAYKSMYRDSWVSSYIPR